MSILQQLLLETPLTCCKNIHSCVGLNVKTKLPFHKNVFCDQMVSVQVQKWTPSCSYRGKMWISRLWRLALEVEMEWLKLTLS